MKINGVVRCNYDVVLSIIIIKMIDKSTVGTLLSIKVILIKQVSGSSVYGEFSRYSLSFSQLPLTAQIHPMRLHRNVYSVSVNRIQVPCRKLHYSHRLCCGLFAFETLNSCDGLMKCITNEQMKFNIAARCGTVVAGCSAVGTETAAATSASICSTFAH